ncbi:MAG: DNA polymerase III subunit delta, partial [Woeseiaceae bacterium]|nr:DNA polymerase III subunit delta [Woeseiaceae bacterium]
MKLDANQLAQHLNNNLAPCYLVSGDEHLLVDEALDRIRAAARDRGFTARELHVATTGFDWSQLGVAGANLSLFAERRIIELRIPTGKPGRDGSAAIAAFTKRLGDDVLFIVSTPKLDRNQSSAKWVKALGSNGVFVPVWPVDVRELPRWIAGRMRDVGLQPDRAAATVIADRVEGNLLAAKQEIEKLRLLLGEGPVTEEDVTRAVADSSRYDVYKLVDAAVGGNARRAIRILRGLQAEGVEPVIVNWALTRELRTLAQLADHVRRNGDLGAAMQQHRVWRNRMNIVRSCVSRHSLTGLYDL